MGDDAFYGSVTVGERGQIVIPSEARTQLGYHPGDKLLVIRHPVHEGLMICKLESVREFLDDFTSALEQAAASEPVHFDPSKESE